MDPALALETPAGAINSEFQDMADGPMVRREPELMLRLTPGTSIIFIDNHPIIVSRERRTLFEVNRIGGYIGCRLEDGVSLRQLAQEVGDRGFGRASAILSGVLAEWSHSGLVYATDSPPTSAPSRVQLVGLAGMRLLLRYHDDGLARRVGPLFDHLNGPGGQPEATYDLWSAHGLSLLSRDGGRASVLQPEQAGPVVKARITQDIIGDLRWRLALHAGCLSRDDRALLLTGRPGAGKTTLTSWLLGAGFAYQGDDITMVDASGRVQGLPFLPTIKSGGWRLMASRYADRLRPAIHRRPDGKRVRYLLPPVLGRQEPVKLGWIVKLRRTKGRAARLAPLSRTLMLRHLLAEAASATGDVDRPTLDTLIGAVAAARGFELHYDDLDEAASLLARLCDDGAP